ncbi:MAG: hypothetical protein A2Y67_04340 [Candidatus Buchananbacteria bacterium RBG_13_39_9]|uniref:GTA TIM-barrel-like domain-containing protein n=1 Tax=Candidatus Buchananbacteria bacterium RBG_13_39_9 TaxID=1797531 RepID=A0A1G1XRT7_9BACT|nr:MAG: hypothetical protein A2Y67_04340 [Candidatus Buchananbacteria bacterium RBG_13_39_9]
MKKIFGIAVLVLVCVGLFLGAFNSWSADPAPESKVIPKMKGGVLTSWYPSDYESNTVEQTLRQMKKDGCEYVAVMIVGYQDSVNSTRVYSLDGKSPTKAGIIHVTNYAHSLGLKVFFKPQINITNSDAWCGTITFIKEEDWISWFKSYKDFIGYYLDLAQSLKVEGFIIGTELVGTEDREADWRDVVSMSRSKFPDGLISYCANHDSYFRIKWWDAVDFIGISAYFKLTESYQPSVPEIISAWQPWINDLAAFSAEQKKDIVFLEIGYQSRDGANTNPNWAPTKTPDLQEQADCYEAAFKALSNQPWLKDMFWWMWYWDPIQNVDGFDIYTKPAEKILRKWYRGN